MCGASLSSCQTVQRLCPSPTPWPATPTRRHTMLRRQHAQAAAATSSSSGVPTTAAAHAVALAYPPRPHRTTLQIVAQGTLPRAVRVSPVAASRRGEAPGGGQRAPSPGVSRMQRLHPTPRGKGQARVQTATKPRRRGIVVAPWRGMMWYCPVLRHPRVWLARPRRRLVWIDVSSASRGAVCRVAWLVLAQCLPVHVNVCLCVCVCASVAWCLLNQIWIHQHAQRCCDNGGRSCGQRDNILRWRHHQPCRR